MITIHLILRLNPNVWEGLSTWYKNISWESRTVIFNCIIHVFICQIKVITEITRWGRLYFRYQLYLTYPLGAFIFQIPVISDLSVRGVNISDTNYNWLTRWMCLYFRFQLYLTYPLDVFIFQIPVKADLPVGNNLEDHLQFFVKHTINQTYSLSGQSSNLFSKLQYTLTRSGEIYILQLVWTV